MRHAHPRLLAALFGAAFAFSGGCLPDNFFSDLAGQLISESVGAVVATAVDGVLTTATQAAE